MVRSNNGKALKRVGDLLPWGFESFQLHWWAGIGGEKLRELADNVTGLINSAGTDPPVISALGLYGNPIRRDSEGEEARRSIRELIGNARYFGCNTIGLFTGRLPDAAWEDSEKDFIRVFGDFCLEAADNGVRLAMENCPMDGDKDAGDWNLAFNPDSWKRLFNLLPGAGQVLGLEWEPAHQIIQDLDPMVQFDDWSTKMFHVHGKDAARIHGNGYRQALPGNGITAWDNVFHRLGESGYSGSVDIEGYHDTDWNGENEITGQLRSLGYLKACRDGILSGPNWIGEDIHR